MRLFLRLTAILVLCAVGVWVWFFLHPGPEKVIRKRLMELAESASYSSKESPIARIASAQTVSDFFAKDALVVIGIPGVAQHTCDGRDEIAEAALMARSTFRAIKIEIPDMKIMLAPDRKSAQVELTAKVSFSNDKDFEPQEVKILLKKIDDDWLITRAETVEVLN